MIKELFSKYDELCIVGSAGILRGKGLGEQIDKEKNIVRFNAAPIKGHEKDVGSRQTIRSAKLLAKSNCIEDCLTHDLEYLLVKHTTVLENYKRNLKMNFDIMEYPHDKLMEYRDMIEYPSWGGPEIGLVIIKVCIELGIKTKLYGFNTEENYNKDDYFHYWGKDNETKNWHMADRLISGHDWVYSRRILSKWLKECPNLTSVT